MTATLYVLEIDSDSLFEDIGPSREGGAYGRCRAAGRPRKIELPAGTLTEPGGIAGGEQGELWRVGNHLREAGVGEVLEIDWAGGTHQ